MNGTYLTGGELSALTIIWWTTAPYQDEKPRWLDNAISGLISKELATRDQYDPENINLTDKGRVLVEAFLIIPEPTQKWVTE